MKIGGLQKLTLIDYPGKIACTVFLAGCNYRCPWCFNPELVLPEKIKEIKQIPEREFFKFLKERKELLEGVCITGGEPTLNSDLPEFCQKIKKIGYSIKIDTNGSNPKMLKDLINRKLVDYVAMDIKAPQEKYKEAIGFKNRSFRYLLGRINKSIDILKKEKVDYEFRTTMIPGLLGKEDIIKIVQWIEPAKRYCLQNFRPGGNTVDANFKNMKPCLEEYLLEIQKAVAPFFEICQVR